MGTKIGTGKVELNAPCGWCNVVVDGKEFQSEVRGGKLIAFGMSADVSLCPVWCVCFCRKGREYRAKATYLQRTLCFTYARAVSVALN